MQKLNTKMIVQGAFYTLALAAIVMSLIAMTRGFQTESFLWIFAAVVLAGVNFVDLSTAFKPEQWQFKKATSRDRFEPTHLAAAILFFLYTVSILWSPLLHPKQLMGGYDMQFFYDYKCYWIQSLKEGDPALWNPYYHLGTPFWGWPIVGACSPFTPLYFLFPVSYAITLEYLLHFLLSAFGTYLFVRTIGGKWTGSVLAAMAYTFGAYYMSKVYQGQAWTIFTAAWIPWILWGVEKSIQEKSHRLFWLTLTSIFCALTYFEGHPQLTEYALLTMGFYLLGSWLFRCVSFKTFLFSGLGLAVAFLALAALALLPQSEYAMLTNRWGWHYGDIMDNWVAPDSLPTFLLPLRGSPFDSTGFKTVKSYHETCNYIGYFPLLLFFSGFFLFRKIPKVLWFSLTVLFFTLMAMGIANPISKAIFDFFYHFVPGFNHHRTIGRIMVISTFFMACSAGLIMDFLKNHFQNRFGAKAQWVSYLLLLFTVLELWFYGHRFVGLENPDNYYSPHMVFSSDRVLKTIQADPSYPRIQGEHDYATNMVLKLTQPLYWEDTYPADEGRYVIDMHDDWDTPLSDLINLKYLASWKLFTNPTPRWQPLFDNVVVNTMALPHAYVVGGYQVWSSGMKEDVEMIRLGDLDCKKEVLLYSQPPQMPPSQPAFLSEAKITHYSNNEVDIECSVAQPGILFLSDPYFPGWSAWVNGQKAEILRADRVFRALVLPQAGNYKIKMAYQPGSLYSGIAISSLGWLAGAVILVRGRKGGKDKPRKKAKPAIRRAKSSK